MRAISPHFRFAIAIAAVGIAVLVPASGASASQVTYGGSVLTYNAASGEVNSPIVTVNPSGDHAPPRARLGRASVRGPFMLLRLSFPNEPGAVTGSVGVVKLQRGGARFRTPPGRGVVVKVRLRTAARRALASGARARAVVTIRARDTAGNTSVTRRRIKLRAP